MNKFIALAIFLVSCSPSLVDQVYSTENFDDAPQMLKTALLNCKTQCSYTVLSSHLVKENEVPMDFTMFCRFIYFATVLIFLS